MAQEEHHTPRCSNSSGGGGGPGGGGGGGIGGNSHRSSKKLKHKKVPQRGMGVAQLEKIISEEQQKKDVVIITPGSIISPSNASSCLATIQSVPSFRPPPMPSPSIPLPPPLPPNHHHHHHHPLIPKTDALNHNSLSVPSSSKQINIGGGGGGGGGSSNWNRLWGGGEYNFDRENQNHGLEHRGYPAAFPANLDSLPYQSNPTIWPSLPNIMQRSQLFQQPSPSSVVVNVSTGTSSSSSSSAVVNFQIEPPSNQSYSSTNYPPLWPEEEKMVGMKRPYPFSLENMPIPSFHCKFPPSYVSAFSRSEDSASCSNGGSASIEAPNPVFRENPSGSRAITDPIPKKFIDESRGETREFLSLAPPQASQLSSSSKERLHPSTYIEPPQFEALPPPQGQTKEPTPLPGRGGSNHQPLLSFFPAAKTPMGQAGNSNGGQPGEGIDLDLKL